MGLPPIHGELDTMGVVIAASSVWAILSATYRPVTAQVGTDLSRVPRRPGERPDGATSSMSTPFSPAGVLAFIHHDSRFVRIAGITSNPVTSWVTQQARNISMERADQANTSKFLVRVSRHQVHRLLRRGLRRRRHESHHHPHPSIPGPTPRVSASSAPSGASAPTECSSSAVATSKQSLPSKSSITTRTGPTAPSASDRPPVPMRPLPPSGTLTPPGYEEPIV